MIPEKQDSVLPGKEGLEKQEESTGKMERLRKKYKNIDGKIYEVITSIQEDDENETEYDFIFRKPATKKNPPPPESSLTCVTVSMGNVAQ